MKILVSYRGIPQSKGWATGDFVVNALLDLGHDVYPYGNYYQTNQTIDDLDNQKLLDYSNYYDLYIQMECGDGDRFYQEVVNAHCDKRVTWWFDSALYPARWIQETALISSDVDFIANKNLLSKKINTVYLPYAADYYRHAFPISFKDDGYWIHKDGVTWEVNKDIDFLIIGSDRPERQQLFESVKSIAPNTHYITNVFREEYVSYLTRSHYVINDVAGGGAGLIPMRPFETIAAGSHLITPHDDGCKELGLPCFEYRNMEELLDLVKSLNDRERPIRFGFQQEFLTKHTYKNRCQAIIDTVFK